MDNIRIGTRASKLAVWQAKQVQALLQKKNISSSIIKIKSSGDKDLSKPVYELGITGVFTKELDIALLNNEIDIVINTTEGAQSIEDSAAIRQTALRNKIFCTTTMFGALAVMEALKGQESDWTYSTLQEINK